MPLSKNTKSWLRGLWAAFIGGAATVLTVQLVDPHQMNWENVQKLLVMAGVSGFINLVNFLKQSPLPADELTVTKTESTTVSVNPKDSNA